MVCQASSMDPAEFFLRVLETLATLTASLWASLLSWPVAFALVVAFFYKPLRGILGRLRSGKIGGVEFDVAGELVEAGAALSEAEAGTMAISPSPIAVEGRADATSTVVGDVSVVTDEVDATLRPSTGTPEAAPSGGRPASDNLARSWFVSKMLAQEVPNLDRAKQGPLDALVRAYNQLEDAIARLYTQSTPGVALNQGNAFRQTLQLYLLGLVDEGFVESFQRLQRIRDNVLKEDADFSSSEAQAFGSIAARLRRIVDAKVMNG